MDKVTRFVCLLLMWGMVFTACQSPPTPTVDETATASLESALPIQTFSGRLDQDQSLIPCGQDQTAPETTYSLLVDEPFIEMVKETNDEILFAMAGTYGPEDELAIFVRFQGKQDEDQAIIRVTELLEMQYYLVPHIPCD